jgi:hypothetical protein
MTQFWENGAFSGLNDRSQVFEKDTMSLWFKRRWKCRDDTWKTTSFSQPNQKTT